MAYIYKITNLLNNKVYVGKTLSTPEKRWKEHINDSKKPQNAQRPLYRAFSKYGIENFQFEIIEECSSEEVNEKEIQWIEIFGSFKHGYNATQGGDGKHYCDYDLIYALFQEGKNIKQIAELTHYDIETCRKALDNFNITVEMRRVRGRESVIKSVIQLDKNTNEILAIYPSIQMAYKALNKQHSGHIASVCTGKRKTAYGYKWKYSE